AGKEGRRDLGEVPLHRVEGLGETSLDRLRQLRAQLLELLEARLEILALRRELLEAGLLRVVLLFRERGDLAERLTPALEPAPPPPLEPLRGLCERIAIAPLRALVGARVLEAPPRLVGLGLDPRQLHVDRRDRRRRVGQRLAQLDLGRAEPPQLLAELTRSCAAGVDPCPKRRLEAGGRLRGARERRVEPLGSREYPCELVRPGPAPARADGRVDPRRLRRARVVAEPRGLRCGSVGFAHERAGLHAERLGVATLHRTGRAAEPHEVAFGCRGTVGVGGDGTTEPALR